MGNSFNNIIRELVDNVYKSNISNVEKEKIIKYTIIITNNYEKISKQIGAPIEKDDFLVNVYEAYLKSLSSFDDNKSSISSFTSLILKRSLQNYIRKYSMRYKRNCQSNIMDKFIREINELNSKNIESEYIEKVMWDDYIERKTFVEKKIIKSFLDGSKRIELCRERDMSRSLVDKCWKDMKNFKQNILNNI